MVGLIVAYFERIPFPAEPKPRFWRGNLRVVVATWGGVAAGFVPGITLHLSILLGTVMGMAAACGVLALPNRRHRREDVAIEVSGDELTLSQGSRTRRVLLSNIRRAAVLTPTGTERRPVGYGWVFGQGLRWTLEVPDPALGVVRIDRSRDGFDIDVATARPEALVRALRS